jgi:hypothetical protein
MGDPEIPVGGVEGAPAGAAPRGADQRGGPVRNKGGRKTKAEEVAGYLASQGLIATPAAADGEGAEPAPMVDSAPFDEAAARAGVEGLVNVANEVAVWRFTRSAEGVIGNRRDAELFGVRARITPPVQEGIVNAGVECQRKHNVTLGPEGTLSVLVLAVLGQWTMLGNDLKELAAARARAGVQSHAPAQPPAP